MQRTAPPAAPRLRARLGKAALAAVLAASLTPFVPAAAHATETGPTMADQIAEANAQIAAQGFTTVGNQSHDWAEGGVSANARNAAFPASYDLRDQGVVTPVKLQNPWGTCWGFAAIAASETSILSELKNAGKDYSASSPFYDLSERQLAWFAYSPVPANDPNGQGGEGQVHMASAENPNAPFNTGGMPVYATSVFSSGIGPLPESMAPYGNDEGLIQYSLPLVDEEGNYVTDEDGNYVWDETSPWYYSDQGTWAVDESLRYTQLIELEETRVLPVPAVVSDTDGDYVNDTYEYDAAATDAIKQELMEGRAVSISFCADQSLPGQVTQQGYMNPETWAHYTYTPEAAANHAVTIVGWDDSYSAENFGNPDATGTVPADHRPPADGAWIVKNSWGAAGNESPNQSDWGADEDGDGKGDGYFYLSYYDNSLSTAETFDYDIENIGASTGTYYNNSYDYLPTSVSFNETSAEPVSTANVFAAEGDQTVRTLACETALPNTEVTYELYQLDPGFTSPTDGTKAAEITEFYEYGGFHRVDLAENQQLKVEQGGTFSVVVTQRSGSDYYYTLDAGSNETYVEMYNNILRQQYEAACAQFANTMFYANYGKYFDEATATEEERDFYQMYYDILWKLMEASGSIRYAETYSNAVLNPGESLLYQNGQWIDETDLIETVDAGQTGYFDFDNFSIKAYSDDTPLADEDLVTELGGTIESAEVLQGSARVSVDGTDVPSDEHWVSQDVSDALSAAIESARPVFDAATADWTQVTDAQLNEALDALANAMNAFQTAEKPGLLASASSLEDLRASVDEAQSDLDAVKVSADGTDVPIGARWTSQEAKDALQAAIGSAQAVLDAESPTQNDADAAMQALAEARTAFQSACSDGTMIKDGTLSGQTSGKGSGPISTQTLPGKGASLAQTGDALPVAVVAVAAFAAATAGCTVLAARHRVKR